jgi:hypothetical protein
MNEPTTKTITVMNDGRPATRKELLEAVYGKDMAPSMPAPPEMWTLRLDTIEEVRECLMIGIEYTREVLARLDAEVGRKHRSNILNANRIEKEIARMTDAHWTLLHPSNSTANTTEA